MRQFDLDVAIQRLAERRIEEAMREGKFDNLPGRGAPVDLDDMPVDPNARMVWWALRTMRNAGHTPDATQLQKRLDSLREEVKVATTEERVRSLVGTINTLIKQVNSTGTGATTAPADLGRELGRLHQRHRVRATPIVELVACPNAFCASANPGAARFCRRCGGRLGYA